MFRNYFLTAWRNLIHNKGYSALNILGLSIGMAVALILGLWVQYQYSFDRSLPGHDQVYQAHIRATRNGSTYQMSSTCLPMAAVLKKEIPEILYAAHTDWMGSHGLVAGENKVSLGGAMAEGEFFQIFPYPVVKGNLSSALANVYSIV